MLKVLSYAVGGLASLVVGGLLAVGMLALLVMVLTVLGAFLYAAFSLII